jgi:hypothetical protein
MPVPRLRQRGVPVDYIVVRETTLDGAEKLDGFESIPRTTTIDDILRSNERRQRRQLQPTPSPTSLGDESDSDDDDDDNIPTPARENVRISGKGRRWRC